MATELLVVGAGPTGLTLALQAHDHGALVRIIDRRPEPFRPSRALIVYPRTLEVLRPLGVTEALLARADLTPRALLHLGARRVAVELAALALPDTAFPHLTLVRQMDVETVLRQALADRGILVEWGSELVADKDGSDAARATVQTGLRTEQIVCDFIAGCDGQESTVRRTAGIRWEGGSYGEEVVLADIELDAGLASATARVVVGRRGVLFLFPQGERATWRLLVSRSAAGDQLPFGQPGPPVPRSTLQALLDDAGLNARITVLAWSARYRLQHRLAARFRRGRLFLLGDAAHAHSPATGQGMNTGIQDAANLGWKLAFAGAATDRAALLASYEQERRQRARQVLALTNLAFWGEAGTGLLPALLRGVLARVGAPAVPLLLRDRRLVAAVVSQVSQLRAPYRRSALSLEGTPPLAIGPRVGERLPDAAVIADGRYTRLQALLARPGVHVLLQREARFAVQPALGPRVTVHRVMSAPGSGVIAVRPDGYIGFCCGVADGVQLRAWLAKIGAGAAAEAGLLSG